MEKAKLFERLGSLEDNLRFRIENAEYHENTMRSAGLSTIFAHSALSGDRFTLARLAEKSADLGGRRTLLTQSAHTGKSRAAARLGTPLRAFLHPGKIIGIQLTLPLMAASYSFEK